MKTDDKVLFDRAKTRIDGSKLDDHSKEGISVALAMSGEACNGMSDAEKMQTMQVHSFAVVDTNVVIIGTVKQVPLVNPILDWRQSLNGGAWSNVTATVTQVDVPAGVTNAVRAYQFVLPKPSNTSAFFRVVDNSTGASGSGLYWLVFGGITVDGQRGMTGSITNVVGSVTNLYQIRGGIVVNPIPL